jgi:FO synthase
MSSVVRNDRTPELSNQLRSAAAGIPLSEVTALELANPDRGLLPSLLEAARDVRDRRWGRRITFSPKVFLPITNLCRNRCDYCSFRRSPGDTGEWTMTPAEIEAQLSRAREQGLSEALLCLGDKPEKAFASYRRTLASLGHESTVDYLERAAKLALDRGLLPHTNAGLLSEAELVRLKPFNVSFGLMLENSSPRLCEKGMPHHRAPDKRPDRRLEMIAAAGRAKIAFTTGILVGIGETRRERAESLLAIRELHRRYGHIQEVIVQSFTPRPGIRMADVGPPEEDELLHAVALARLILDPDVGVQAPPNLTPDALGRLLDAGINDFGGISPVTPDYINPRHAWPELAELAETCAHSGYTLAPRLPVYDEYLERPEFVAPDLRLVAERAAARIAERFVFEAPVSQPHLLESAPCP